MMAHSVDVRQLTARSSNPNTHMNVLCDYGHIGIWTAPKYQPTYLCRDEYNVYLIQFENEAFADEWISENTKKYGITEVTRL